uniref:Uncharacterized protein n=1 Tax=Ananas comosus var. bracteatus TaxID=296719 RepID=A0A6V7NRV1_ANACO|nr:unnamed protein product [Ananas comosus var. bracteatus]
MAFPSPLFPPPNSTHTTHKSPSLFLAPRRRRPLVVLRATGPATANDDNKGEEQQQQQQPPITVDGTNNDTTTKTPRTTLNIKYRVRSKNQAKQRKAAAEAPPSPPPKKEWDAMTLGEKAVELYVGRRASSSGSTSSPTPPSLLSSADGSSSALSAPPSASTSSTRLPSPPPPFSRAHLEFSFSCFLSPSSSSSSSSIKAAAARLLSRARVTRIASSRTVSSEAGLCSSPLAEGLSVLSTCIGSSDAELRLAGPEVDGRVRVGFDEACGWEGAAAIEGCSCIGFLVGPEEKVVLLAAVAAERMRVGGWAAQQEAVAELLAVAASVSRNKYVRTTG